LIRKHVQGHEGFEVVNEGWNLLEQIAAEEEHLQHLQIGEFIWQSSNRVGLYENKKSTINQPSTKEMRETAYLKVKKSQIG